LERKRTAQGCSPTTRLERKRAGEGSSTGGKASALSSNSGRGGRLRFRPGNSAIGLGVWWKR
jgi:hypothetical protein